MEDHEFMTKIRLCKKHTNKPVIGCTHCEIERLKAEIKRLEEKIGRLMNDLNKAELEK